MTTNALSTRRGIALAAIAAGVLMLPTPALANSGTPMMMIGALHLLFGNLLIGAIEGLLVAIVFKLSKWKAVLLAIAANYVSMIGGIILTGLANAAFTSLLGQEGVFYNLVTMIMVLLVVAVILSLLLEWPFFAWAAGKAPDRFRRSIKATIVANIVSYAIILPLYYWVTFGSLITHVKRDPSLVAGQPNNATIYFVADDNWLCSIRINGTGQHRIKDLGQCEFYRMYPAKNWSGWKLAFDGVGDRKVPEIDLGNPDVLAWRFNRVYEQGSYDDYKKFSEDSLPWYYFNAAARSEVPHESQWIVSAGLYTAEGLKVKDPGGHWQSIGIETPVLAWSPNQPSHLPNDTVVYQLGPQIVLYDLATKRMGYITQGRLPVVVMDSTPGATQPTSQSAVDTGKPLSAATSPALDEKAAGTLAAKLATEAFAKGNHLDAAGKQVIATFTAENWRVAEFKDGRWVLKCDPPAGSWAFVSFGADGGEPKVEVGFATK